VRFQVAKSTFDETLLWLRAQLLLEVDRIRTIHGLTPRPQTSIDELKSFTTTINDCNQRLANYVLLLKKLQEAVETPAEAQAIVQGSSVLNLLNQSINMTIAVVQVELQRRGVDPPAVKRPT